MECFLIFRFSSQPLAFLLTLREKLVVKPHIEEAFCRYNAVAVLQMVGGVIGICHNKHIVTFVCGAHAVVTDNDAPMPAPIDVFYNNRGIMFQIALDKFKEILIAVGSFIFDGGMELPTDFSK